MDPGYRSPLLDLFRRGDSDKGIRMVAAKGALGLRALEQVALLMMLLDDADPEVAAQAETTIGSLPEPALSSFLARADVPDVIRDFFATRGVLPAGLQPPIALDDEAEPLGADVPPDGPEAATSVPADAALLSSLPILDRLKLATKGTREQRAQLIRDSNRMVALAVLSSPKINESEIEVFAKMASVTEDILRVIGSNRTWMKHYGVAHGLVRNPKTPPGMSMQLLHRLTERDVRAVTTDRNVPETVRLAARRLMSRTQK